VFGILPEKSVFALGWNLDKRQALVDLDDVAAVLVKVIGESDAHFGATYELTSGENFSAHDIAAALSEAFGRPFRARWFEQRFEPNPTIFGHYDEAHSRHQMEVFRVVNAWYDRFDFLGNASVLRMLLGREPTSFTEFVRRHYGL
jgi:uncharacterized protein YbjT (DUF2867 family)